MKKFSFSTRAGVAASVVTLACLAWNYVPRAYSQGKTDHTLSAVQRARVSSQVRTFQNFRNSLSPSQRKLPTTLLLAQPEGARVRAALPKMVTGSKLQALQAPHKVVIHGEMTARIKAAIQREGTLTGFFPEAGVATAVLSTTAMEHIATADEIDSIILDFGRITSRSAPPSHFKQEIAKAAVKAAWNKVCSGTVVTEGDKTHLADQVRTSAKVSGKGIKVGVISDSSESLATLRASGELPDDVQVLSGQAGKGHSEGTAMMEIIHDLAPDAKLEFATAGDSPNQMAQNILGLQKAGCNIIVDDITFGNETVYQEDVISAAVRQVATSGVVYLSSMGNFGNRELAPTGVWDSTFVDNGQTDDGSLIFNTWTGQVKDEDAGNLVTSGGGTAILQWADPAGKSSNDYGLYLFDNDSNLIDGSDSTQDGNDQAIEGVFGTQPGDFLVATRVPGSKLRPMRMVLFNDSSTLQYSVGPTGSGHNVSEFAVSVAASPARNSFADGAPAGPYPKAFDSSSKVEPFSSTGPRTLYFTPSGDAQSRLIKKPDITAADGVSCATPDFNPFFGTSAAAPHAAALAALAWSQDLSASADTIRKKLLASTIDIGVAGYDYSSGNGIVMADKLISSTTNPTATPKPTPTTKPTATPKPTGTPKPTPTSTPAPSGGIAFSEPTYSVNENAGSATISVRRIGSGSGAVSVKYQTTTGGTATANSDYQAVTGTLSWASGDTNVKTFTVPIVDDKIRERTETVNLRIYDASGATTIVASRQTAVLSITDNETGQLDSTSPKVAIANPQDGSRVSNVNVINGTASDEGGSLLSSVVISIQRPNDGSYWNGGSWVKNATTLVTVLTGSTWKRTSGNPPQSALYDDFLLVTAIARDGVGNTGKTTSRFFVDPSAPQVFINTPKTGARLTTLSKVAGTVSDTSSDSTVVLYLQRVKDGKYYTGSGFGNKTALSVNLAESGEFTRSGFPSLDAGDYVLTALATDSVGNTSTAMNTFTITGTTKSSGSDS